MSLVFPRQLLPESSQLLEGSVCPAGAERGFCSVVRGFSQLRVLLFVYKVEVEFHEYVFVYTLAWDLSMREVLRIM